MTRCTDPTRRLVVLTFALVLGGAAARAQAPPVEPPLTIDSIRVTPDAPTASTLCHLTIAVTNATDRPISRLGLAVTVNGRPVKAYERTLYMQTLRPHATTEIPLYNFWTTESSRPASADNRLVLEVAVVRAAWTIVTTPAGVPTMAAAGSVAPLPAAKRIVVPLKPL